MGNVAKFPEKRGVKNDETRHKEELAALIDEINKHVAALFEELRSGNIEEAERQREMANKYMDLSRLCVKNYPAKK